MANNFFGVGIGKPNETLDVTTRLINIQRNNDTLILTESCCANAQYQKSSGIPPKHLRMAFPPLCHLERQRIAIKCYTASLTACL
ncbi:uncharacterized protein L203_101408 [Cryptococcus depauperatus CBS 7841]|uniref:Uncharacterized protein n=1 Tax=Cryptococcus depauperatus CBS 7841 TaxID=1295531 RepID=A0AAJ8JPY0_9TREE